ncbi:choline/ethanolaminephosphotransferase 1-like [Gigantopelta aegis]|uniref:choline/ethanolaminephosphotransferase 1-like n=1 Tax=Gigantopelta aegis TaxID=1735272 RepID=UPI001B8880C7|nr:choline/ethanolaminephosphotransferase 1-like [Gigantopelta aegis]
MTEILSTVQLKKLSNHKYSVEGTSFLEPPMQKFWRWLIEQVPTWWSPNAITLVGLIINITTTLILAYYSPDARQPVPPWAYILCAVGLFAYQSLDAIDGKQARRTNTSTPLGELFDHGCDSVSQAVVVLGSCIALRMGENPAWMLFFGCVGSILFYCAHYQTYVSGTLRFSKIDVTEGQICIIGIYLLSALFGDVIWTWPLPYFGVELKMLPIAFSLVGAVIQLKNNFAVIFMEGGVGKNGSTVAGTSTIFPMFPMALVIALEVMLQAKSPNQLYEKHPCLYVITFGLLAAKVTNRLVVAHMSKSEMNLFCFGLVGPGLLFLNQYFNSCLNEYFVLWLAFVIVLVDLYRYSSQVCREICKDLNIYCFTITSKPVPTSSEVNGTKSKNR